jgi:hypothetical protein
LPSGLRRIPRGRFPTARVATTAFEAASMTEMLPLSSFET